MDFLDLTLPTAAENVALDEALLLKAEAGEAGEILRLWENPRPAVVLGAGCILNDDVNVDGCRRDDVEIVRRSSGGGTVLLGPGCLCFSLVLAQEDNPALSGIRTSYELILGSLARALSGSLAGISDLTRDARKFSGNAQQRKRRYLLHHGTLLYAFDLEAVSRYLRLPPRRPEYRGDRPHEDFVRNLPLSRDDIVAALRRLWPTTGDRVSYPAEEVARAVSEKYGTWEWASRR